MKHVEIAFFGTSEFAVPILDKLAATQWRPALAVTTPDAPAGRGLTPKPPPVKIAAERLGINVIQPETLSPIPYPLFAGIFDLFIVAAYGKILPPELLKIPKSGSLNIHPSLLPRWRGPSPVQYTILNGDQETGVTIILMDEKVDHGPVVKFKNLNIESKKLTAPELTKQLAEMGAKLLLETISHRLDGKIAPRPQDETKAAYSKMLKKEDGHIDWSQPAEKIERMVRAFQPWPGTYAFWPKGGKRVRLALEEAEVRSKKEEVKRSAGAVFEDNGALSAQTGDGVLIIRILKPEGGKSMSGQEFLRGHHDIIGAVLE